MIKKYSSIVLSTLFFLSGCGTETTNDTSDTNDTVILQDINDTLQNITIKKSSALEQLNQIRTQLGLNPLKPNPYLTTAAQNHAKYLFIHHISGHYETQGQEGFTGKTPLDRTIYAGYKSRAVSENVSTGQKDEQASIDGLMSAIYHRLGFLDMNIDEIGTANEQNSSYVYDMGNSYLNALCNGQSFDGSGEYYYDVCANEDFKIKATTYNQAKNQIKNTNPTYVIYPYKNQQEVNPVFYEESPDPLPDYSVSGYPISILFNDAKIDTELLNVTSFTLTTNHMQIPLIQHNDGSTILTQQNDINDHLSAYEFAIFAKQRLDYNTTYQASFVYNYNGEDKNITWSFTTKSLPNLITFENKDINIALNTPFYLYFPPKDQNDVINSNSIGCTYTQGGYAKPTITFYDQNTLFITINGKDIDSCDVNINGEKKLTLHIQN
ncbi:putative periplasmic protein [hydrothermal vent metagenome]|uniref:Putative periplasmic protein n=1 Tax=hydrothermal vent metagenome TaxID=652676 RepID=A0A1W1BIF3_9ZZZZ